ncbi:hypothetical protein SAMN05192574_105251 [Mucilaginibacter gossypiicola]|uniref:Uncharacterized protein n=1 Tax=Mucilaginibacter gossypiicola TaxID=551995 RepID=A0A1H8LU46_9SPHI|nr:hypothetical protein [Mucilaginibacter gossypiicola]SEO08651.1 hypothetical protein SAMN05192574_105251 [Mucilaginibacter gossypiicola]
MRSKLFTDKPETVKTGSERWVRIVPNGDATYSLFDLLNEIYLGRILFDEDHNWIYDGRLLSVDDQEDIAAKLTGSQKEMDQLLKSLKL